MAKLQRVRDKLTMQYKPKLIKRLVALETSLEVEIRKEIVDVIASRRRSRVKWLSVGDAMSPYFLAQYKAK